MTLPESRFSLTVDGVFIKGEVFIPKKRQPKSGLIICHGIPGGENPGAKQQQGYEQLGRLFCRQGHLSLIFNFRGTGESGGNLDLTGWVKDLQSVIEYYYAKYHEPSFPLIIAGFSAGAAVAVEAASRDRRIKALALGACPANFDFFLQKFTKEQLWEWFNITGLFRSPGDLPSVEIWSRHFFSVRPEKVIADIYPRRLLIMHGDKDEVVPPHHAEILYNRARGDERRMVMFPGVKHRIRNSRKALRYLQVWLDEAAQNNNCRCT